MSFNKNKIRGDIGYHNLEKWWLEVLTENERTLILRVSGREIIDRNIDWTSSSSSQFLWGLAGMGYSFGDREISRKILLEAKNQAKESSDPLDMHFTLSSQIQMYYKDREKNKDYFRKAVQSCNEQIQMQDKAAQAFENEYPGQPLPSHVGYQQLAIILEKTKKYEETIRLSEDAKKNGWAGDWDKRIERCKKRLEKANN